MALHTGQGEVREGDYVGQALNRVARLLSVAHGGQTLLSRLTCDLVGDALPPGAGIKDLGEHSLKDLQRPEYVFQLVLEGVPYDFPPLNSADARPNNLPAEASQFVGREEQLEALCSLLRRPDVRLLTLTGPGGTGKTRLALQAAAELLRDFSDGVFFIPLAAINDPGLVIPTIAQTLNMKESSGQSLGDSLKGYLRGKHLLLVLDNFEQLVQAATSVAQLLAVSARLKIMVTSQVTLHLQGEQEFMVPPLALPDLKRPPPLEALPHYEAVDLFVQRARLARPDFAVTEQNAPAVIEICHRLDGLPLAIELAAARIKLLPPEAMLSRLAGMAGTQNSLKLLVGGARDLPARQQALRSTIEWSYDLLDEGEKTLFRRLSVFAGGCTLEAAEAVCDAGETGAVDVFDGVGSLVDRSLLRSASEHEQAPHNLGEPRFSMLETIREYARERLEECGEAQATRQRHAAFYLALAEKAEFQAPMMRHSTWLEKVEAEQDNLRAVLQWAIEQGETETALRLSGTLSYFWQIRGNMSEGRRWVEVALALPGASAYRAAYAQALLGAGVIAWFQGDPAAARSWCEESAAIHRELGDQRGLALTLITLGQSTLFLGDAAKAGSLLEEGLALHRQTGVKWGIAQALFVSAQVKVAQGDFGAARSYFEESLELYRQLGNDWWVAQALNSLGDLARMQGDYSTAQTLYEESLGLFRELRAKTDLPASLHNLGHLAIIGGNIEQATALFKESLALHRGTGNRPGIIESLAGFAGVAGVRGRPRRAARLFGASDALMSAISAPMWPAERLAYERNMAAARAQLDEDDWLEAWEQGRNMNMEQAVSYALDEADIE
jgi:predicted ATPase